MLNWENYKGTVKVRRVDGTEADEPVTGRRAGYWAVHRSIDGNNWTVSHIKSGMALTCSISTKRAAMGLVEHLGSKVYGFTYFSLERFKEKSIVLEEEYLNYMNQL
tara:strand:+ start:2509 stop:2826 length:318 start_codon:yes stop_codon:yes gene_type:complete